MINLVDLAGSEKVRQVDGSHTEHDPVFCTACFASAWSLTNPGSNISNDNSHQLLMNLKMQCATFRGVFCESRSLGETDWG